MPRLLTLVFAFSLSAMTGLTYASNEAQELAEEGSDPGVEAAAMDRKRTEDALAEKK